MTIIDNGPTVINRGVPATLFEASVGQLPGLFNGKLRPQSLVNADDTVLVEFYGKTTGNATEDLEVSKIMLFTDLHFYLTPLKAIGAYKIDVTLENTSTSTSISLDYEIDREDVI